MTVQYLLLGTVQILQYSHAGGRGRVHTAIEYFAKIQYGQAKAMMIMVLKRVEYYILERCTKVLRGEQKDTRRIQILSPNAFAKRRHGLKSKRILVSRIRRAENFGVTGFMIDAECITREHQGGGRKDGVEERESNCVSKQ